MVGSVRQTGAIGGTRCASPPPTYHLLPTTCLLLALAAVYLLITAWNLNIQTIANPDEPRYAAAARTMLRGQTWQDWVVPFFNAQPRLVKPIFFYWLIAATGTAGEALGLGLVTGFRLGPLLMGLLAVTGTFLLGVRLRSARCGFLAAGVLMTCAEVHKVARELVVDMTLTAFIVWAWVFCHITLEQIQNSKCKMKAAPPHEEGSPKREGCGPEQIENPFLPLLGFYLCLGLACMTKGPFLVALFVVIPLLVYLLWTGRLGDLKHAGLWWGMPLSLALGLWWSLALYKLGYDWRSFFVTENLQRAVGAKDHTSHPWPYLFYLGTLGENFLPWVVVLPFAAWWAFKHRDRVIGSSGHRANKQLAVAVTSPDHTITRSPDSSRFLLCALFVPFFFLGLSVSKRPLYLLPLYPYIALALAWAWDEALLSREGEPIRAPKWVAWLVFMPFWAATVGVGLYLPKLGGGQSEAIVLALLCAALAGCGCVAARELKHGLRHKASLLVLAMAALFCVGFETVWRPVNERVANRKEFYRVLDESLRGQPLVLLGHTSNEAVWYLDRPRERIENVRFPDLKAKFFDAPGTKLLVTARFLDKDLELKQALKTEGLAATRAGEQYLLAEPDPAHPPAPDVFRPMAEREDKGGED